MLEGVHRRKTGALIVASLDAGAVLAGASKSAREALSSYGESIGLAFQIADDVLDVVETRRRWARKAPTATTTSSPTPRCTASTAPRQSPRHVEEAHAHLKPFARKADTLHELADYIIARTSDHYGTSQEHQLGRPT